MNAEECARLVALVRTLYPAQRFDENPENVVNAWGQVIADVGFAEAHEAVIMHARRGSSWISPGDIRQIVARTRNVLAPDVDALLHDVREVATRDGVGRSMLHPAAQRAYETVGGAQAIRRMDSIGLLQLRKVLIEAVETHDRRTLDLRLPPPTVPHKPIEEQLRLSGERELLPPLNPQLTTDRTKELRQWAEGGESS